MELTLPLPLTDYISDLFPGLLPVVGIYHPDIDQKTETALISQVQVQHRKLVKLVVKKIKIKRQMSYCSK